MYMSGTNDHVLAFARASQCAGAPVPMPCPQNQSYSVYHLHLAKMGGRALMKLGPQLVQRTNCRWFAQLTMAVEPGRRTFWGHEAEFAAQAQANAGRKACFASWEAAWPVVAAFGPKVVVVTMLRSATSWLLSAVAHKRQSGHTTGIPDLLRRGCFANGWDPEDPAAPCRGIYPFRQCVPVPEPPAWSRLVSPARLPSKQ